MDLVLGLCVLSTGDPAISGPDPHQNEFKRPGAMIAFATSVVRAK